MAPASRYCSLRDAPGVSYRSLSERADSLPLPPRFTFGPFGADLASRYYHEVVVRETGLYVARGVALSGHFCLSAGDGLLACDALHLHSGTLDIVAPGFDLLRFSRRGRRVPGACVMLGGPGLPVYGHWLVDFLPKLFTLGVSGYDIDGLRYLLPTDTPRFGLALLNLVGIGSEQIVPYDPLFDSVQPDELLIPTLLRTNSRTAPPFAAAASFLARRIEEHHGPTPGRPATPRLFISRARAGRALRTLRNRERIEQLASQAGFVVVHPEQLPLLEQVRLFQGATDIVGEYGSALHATIFSPPGTIVCALRGSGSPIAGFLQSSIGHALGQPTGYVFGSTREGDPLESFEIAERDFALCRDLVFGERGIAAMRA